MVIFGKMLYVGNFPHVVVATYHDTMERNQFSPPMIYFFMKSIMSLNVLIFFTSIMLTILDHIVIRKKNIFY